MRGTRILSQSHLDVVGEGEDCFIIRMERFEFREFDYAAVFEVQLIFEVQNFQKLNLSTSIWVKYFYEENELRFKFREFDGLIVQRTCKSLQRTRREI